MNLKLTIFTNGHEGTWNSIDLGAQLAKALGLEIELIGVVEDDDVNHPVEEIFSKAVTLFQELGVTYDLELEPGIVEDVAGKRKYLAAIPHDINQPDSIVLVGTFGRSSVRKMLVGKSFRYIMESIGQPILYVPEFHYPIKKILMCIGGLGYPVKAEPLILKIAKACGAEITLFTVVPPIEFDYPEARIVKENWQRLAETDTIIGRTLREGRALAKEAGIGVTVKTSHGNINEEIKAEIKHGNYDLVVMGSHFSSHTLRQMYAPNVTADIAESCSVPILTLRCPPQ